MHHYARLLDFAFHAFWCSLTKYASFHVCSYHFVIHSPFCLPDLPDQDYTFIYLLAFNPGRLWLDSINLSKSLWIALFQLLSQAIESMGNKTLIILAGGTSAAVVLVLSFLVKVFSDTMDNSFFFLFWWMNHPNWYPWHFRRCKRNFTPSAHSTQFLILLPEDAPFPQSQKIEAHPY